MDKIRSLILMVYLFGFIGFMPSLIMASESLAFPQAPEEDDGDLLLPQQQEQSLSKEEQQKLVASRSLSATPPPVIAPEDLYQTAHSFQSPTGRLSQMATLGSHLSSAHDQRKLLRAQRHTSLRSPSPAPQQFQSLQLEMPSSAARALAFSSPAPTPSPSVFGGTPPLQVSGAGTPSASPFFRGPTPFAHSPAPQAPTPEATPVKFPSIAASKAFVQPAKMPTLARPVAQVAQQARTLSASQSVNISSHAFIAFSGKGFAKPRTEEKR